MPSDDDMPFKLGLRKAPPDPRTLRLANYMAEELPPAPPVRDWMRKVDGWPLYGNDRIGDCVAVTCAHKTQGWTRYAGTEVRIPEQDVIAAYSAVSGYDPVTGASDDGCVMRYMLNHWRRAGIGGHTIAAYVSVDVNDHDEVRYALNTFGGLAVGIDLPWSAAGQVGQTWRTVRGPDAEPGSWGGHAVRVGKYSPRYLHCSTWGMRQRMTWKFWDAYVMEAYAVLSPEWIRATSGLSPSGFQTQELLADLQRITSN